MVLSGNPLRRGSPDYDYEREEAAHSAMTKWLETGKQRARTVVALGTNVLDQYVGRYQLNPQRTFTVRRDGDKLVIDFPKGREAEMFPESKASFFLKVADVQLSFLKDNNGEVAGMEMILDGQQHLKLARERS
jgi:hypothetical protein